MRLTVISPEGADARELGVLEMLFAAGLEQYRLRKPGWSREALRSWIEATPVAWRSRIVLHGAAHHDLVTECGLGGRHWGDDADTPAIPAPAPGLVASRACHDLETLAVSLGQYDEVLVSPVFSSISKPGHGPGERLPHDRLAALLNARGVAGWRTTAYALGGITEARIPECARLGFDGVAVLGAIWQATDPRDAFERLRDRLLGPAS